MIKRKKKSLKEIIKLKEDLDKRNIFFLSIWSKRPHQCEITGRKLYTINSMYFHHILPKSKYPELEYLEGNIIILHPDIHANVEQDIYRYEEINKRREKLKEKYNI